MTKLPKKRGQTVPREVATDTEREPSLYGFLRGSVVIPPGLDLTEPVCDGRFDDLLQSDPRFLRRIESARKSLREGRGVKLKDVDVGS